MQQPGTMHLSLTCQHSTLCVSPCHASNHLHRMRLSDTCMWSMHGRLQPCEQQEDDGGACSCHPHAMSWYHLTLVFAAAACSSCITCCCPDSLCLSVLGRAAWHWCCVALLVPCTATAATVHGCGPAECPARSVCVRMDRHVACLSSSGPHY